jgi:ABC-type transport system involved in multi-copper enzyme maturation permease subunit
MVEWFDRQNFRRTNMIAFIGSTDVSIVLSVFFGLCFYFAPTLVASCAKSRHVIAIAVFNFFLGWTVLCWILALVWACMAYGDPPETDFEV